MPLAKPTPGRQIHLGFAVGLLLFLAMLVLLFPYAEQLKYQVGLLESGEYWRWWSGHLVHGGRRHLLLNMAAFTMLYLLSWQRVSSREILWLAVFFLFSFAPLLAWFYPHIDWYLGLSGWLHAWMAYLLLRMRDRQPGTRLAIACLVLLWVKVLTEQLGEAKQLDDMWVVSQAHWLGLWLATAWYLSGRLVVLIKQRCGLNVSC